MPAPDAAQEEPAAAPADEREAEALLLAAPALAFMGVALADGSLERAEAGRFRRQLSCGGEYGELFVSVLDRLGGSDRTLDAAVEAASVVAVEGPAAVAAELARARAVLDRDHPDQADRFAADLLAFARGIAEAAAGLYDTGPKVSDVEQAVLDRIAGAVGV